jgi:hypothetical protein
MVASAVDHFEIVEGDGLRLDGETSGAVACGASDVVRPRIEETVAAAFAAGFFHLAIWIGIRIGVPRVGLTDVASERLAGDIDDRAGDVLAGTAVAVTD